MSLRADYVLLKFIFMYRLSKSLKTHKSLEQGTFADTGHDSVLLLTACMYALALLSMCLLSSSMVLSSFTQMSGKPTVLHKQKPIFSSQAFCTRLQMNSRIDFKLDEQKAD